MTRVAQWHRLDRRTVLITMLTFAGIGLAAAVPIAFGMLRNERPAWMPVILLPAGVVLLAVLAGVVDLFRWRHTTYRITSERVELRFSLVLHKLRAIPRERIRSVDVTANPLQRLFGLAKVTVGTGQHQAGDKRLALDPIGRELAERLRAELLTRDGHPAGVPPAVTGEPEVAGEPVRRPVIAELDWSWIRYAPISVTTPLLGGAAFGVVFQVAEWFGAERTVIDTVSDTFLGQQLVIAVLVLAAVGLVVGVIASLVLFVELWWQYRLTREDFENTATLRVRRGLLTTRSLSLEERRLRGVAIVEPLGARLAGGARVDAVATGLRTAGKGERGDPKTLLPVAQRAVARQVAAEILRARISPVESVRLRRHPLAARRRRLVRAVAATVVVAGTLAVLGTWLTDPLLVVAGLVTPVLLAVSIALALDAYRNLGHGITGDYLVTRYGVASRHTVALRRGGVIGWKITRSPFQRRLGLVTLAATTAANTGEYLVRDVDESDGLAFAEEAVPGLLTPFLQRGEQALPVRPPAAPRS